MTAPAGDDLVIGFRDHDRQRYAAKVRLPEAGDFLIGSYREEDGSLAPEGEFRVTLVQLDIDLHPRVEAFGDGTGSLRRAIELGLLDQLHPVLDHVGFSRRLLAIGMADLSDSPLPGTGGPGK